LSLELEVHLHTGTRGRSHVVADDAPAFHHELHPLQLRDVGERIAGGDAIRRTFSRIKATIRLHDAVKVGMVGDRGGWGAANVDFTDEDADGIEVTQTFRVLAAWLKEDAGWRIVQTQWSNPR